LRADNQASTGRRTGTAAATSSPPPRPCRILVEQARHKKSAKVGGHLRREESHEEQVKAPNRDVDLIALDEALDRLAHHDPREAELVKLRFFAGLTIRQAAAALGVAESTADADWAYAKAWLRLELSDAPDPRP
jgi:RNA polymerase sigma factor (TIGR02999 family)